MVRHGDEDARLVEAARAGSRQAFAGLVRRYEPLVFSVAYALAGTRADGEELAQEAFVTAWSRLCDLHRPEQFRSWICGIARNAHRHLVRNRSRRLLRHSHSLSAVADLAAAEPSPLDQVIAREEERLLGRALGEVPEVYRVALVLYYRQGESIEGVAEALELTNETARKRLSLGRRMLQRQVSFVASALARIRPRRDVSAAVMAAISSTMSRPAQARIPPATIRPGRALLVVSTCLVLLSGPRPAGRAPGLGAPNATLRVRAETRGEGRAFNRQPGVAALQPAVFEPRVASGRAIPRFDFEDGLRPSAFLRGEVVKGPGQREGQFCAIGALNLPWGHYEVSFWTVSEPPLVFSPGLTASFDYWLPGDSGDVSIQVGNLNKGANYVYSLEQPVREAWTHAEIPLTRVHSHAGAEIPARMEAGDELNIFGIYGGRSGGLAFYVDNIRFFVDETEVNARYAAAPIFVVTGE